ncbi:TRAP-type C4-dicarboxylate transport system, small permease component [Marinobacterium lacunae]|uniref:TRAP transporter small permease protein n=2 Tax=Marinobacterium lacunae TaxID=1232683 RepID=A0A081FUR3_9GAMM|nr:TRAP-type C4-dicarboxylate transport system, small permease component [Marinobacterium lacunae]
MSVIKHASAVQVERSRSACIRRLSAHLVSIVNLTGATLVIASLSTMFLSILVNVVLRYVFGSGITWAYELPAILFPWAVAGGLVMATAQGRNIAVDAIIKLLPERLRWVLAILINLFTGSVSVGVVYYSLPIVKASQYSRLAETGISQIYGYSSLLYAFSMIALIALLTLIDYLLGQRVEVSDPSESNFS